MERYIGKSGKVRLQGAVKDAADTRYHHSCRKNFMLFKIKLANNCASTSTDSAFDTLVEDITSNKPKISTLTKAMCCMAVKDNAKQSWPHYSSTLMTNGLFSELQNCLFCWCFVIQIQVC